MKGPTWVDAHCHLFLHDDEPAAVIARAEAQGVTWMMVPGVDVATSRQAAALAARFPDRLRWSAGLHPHDAERWPQERDDIAELAAAAAAIGECGLDYYRNLSPPDAQREAFSDQLRLGAELDKPVIVHCRDAFDDVFDAIERAALGERAVMHCWTGGPRWTKRFRELGVTFSFAGPVAFTTGDTVRRGAAEAPPGRVMVETDTPYLAPPPHRQEANEPGYVPLVGAALAGVFGVDPGQVATWTTATAARVFGSPRP
ncbi:MAG TPA: TatD family hydrolase [Acidimicrobiia bacterium]|jgi:TatD DNase family protein